MNINKRGVSLLEIIVAVSIFGLVLVGVVKIFVASKGFIQHSRYRMAGGEIGKQFLDPLQADVRQDQWATNCFTSGNIADCPNVASSSTGYSAAYNITTHSSESNIKKVKVTVSWSENVSSL